MSEPDPPGFATRLGRGFALCAAVLGVIGLLAGCAPLLWLSVSYELAAAYYLRDDG